MIRGWLGFPDPIARWGGEVFPHKQMILRHQKGVQEFDSILRLSARSQHQVPQVKSSVLPDLPHHTHFRRWTQAQIMYF